MYIDIYIHIYIYLYILYVYIYGHIYIYRERDTYVLDVYLMSQYNQLIIKFTNFAYQNLLKKFNRKYLQSVLMSWTFTYKVVLQFEKVFFEKMFPQNINKNW